MTVDEELRQYAAQVAELLRWMDLMRETLGKDAIIRFEGQLLFVRAMTTKHLLPVQTDQPVTVWGSKP